jgi:hypothetical protein
MAELHSKLSIVLYVFICHPNEEETVSSDKSLGKLVVKFQPDLQRETFVDNGLDFCVWSTGNVKECEFWFFFPDSESEILSRSCLGVALQHQVPERCVMLTRTILRPSSCTGRMLILISINRIALPFNLKMCIFKHHHYYTPQIMKVTRNCLRQHNKTFNIGNFHSPVNLVNLRTNTVTVIFC